MPSLSAYVELQAYPKQRVNRFSQMPYLTQKERFYPRGLTHIRPVQFTKERKRSAGGILNEENISTKQN